MQDLGPCRAAVLHAGKHVETEERFGLLGAEFIADSAEIIDGVRAVIAGRSNP